VRAKITGKTDQPPPPPPLVQISALTGAPWHYLHQPLLGLTKATSDRCVEMCAATARVMGEFPAQDDLEKLEHSIQGLLNAR